MRQLRPPPRTSTSPRVRSAKKPNRDVAKMIAGPGVYICNECVELCTSIITDAVETPPEGAVEPQQILRPASADEILGRLPAGRSAAPLEVEAELAAWVSRLREQGTDWRTIAGALDMGVDAARQRFEPMPRG